jgi:Omp85 superfamily domain
VVALALALGSTLGAQEDPKDQVSSAASPAPPPKVSLVPTTPGEVPAPLPMDPATMAPVPPYRPGKPPTEEEKKERKTEFLAAPIPLSNPTLGSGLGLVGAVLFPLKKSDTVSPPSVAGVGGFYTSSHSYAFGGAMRAYISEDRWRLLGGLALAKIHYDLFPIDVPPGTTPPSIPIVQDAKGFSVEGLRRVSKTFLLGAQYLYATTNLRIDAGDSGSEAAPPERDRSLSLASLGLHVESDSRDSTTYPERGILWDLHADFYDSAVGGDRDFQSYKSAVNFYYSPGVRQVIAARLSACDVRGDSPVYTLCLFGSSNDLRGYAVGRYIGRVMLASQFEYRYNLPERLGFFSKFGFVVFGGVGEVARTWGALNANDLLPSGGLGARFLLARENQVNFRVDYAWGKSSSGVYVGVGEAF